MVRTPANAQEAPSFEMQSLGVVPCPALARVLLQLPAVQQELNISDAQKKEQAEIEKRRFQTIRKARTEIKDRAKFQETRKAIDNEAAAAQLANLKREQRERLVQIQLQAQGPLAFSLRDRYPGSLIGDPGIFIGPPLSDQLKMSDDQVKRVRTIAEVGAARIEKAASFRLPWDSKDKPTVETIRKLVEGPEFRAAKAKARRTAREAWVAVVARIETVLNDAQRTNYRRILGKPFDLAKLEFKQDQSETDVDVQEVGSALGLGGQRADPGFDVTVARPTFANLRPRVAIDEAHHNFHTADGRYKPFADLMTNDGFLVSRNAETLNIQTLDRCDILVIANAMAANAGRDAGTASSAFTEDECSAVQRWVWDGGALLLITDHEPYGSASDALAQRFGIVMNTSGTIDPANTDEKTGGLIFTRESQLVVDHPITIGRDPSERINRVETFYGQAVYGPVGSTGFLRFADTATYESAKGEQSAAGWAQGVALGYGAGRLVVMGEAAELSAQLAGLEPMGMNVPGIDNRQMALNIMHWLSGQIEPRTSAVTAGVAYNAPRRRRPFPRLFLISPSRRWAPVRVVRCR
jgi:hypothetical protein